MDILYLLVVGLILVVLMAAITAAKEKLQEQKNQHELNKLTLLAELAGPDERKEDDHSGEEPEEPRKEPENSEEPEEPEQFVKAVSSEEERTLQNVDTEENQQILWDSQPPIQEDGGEYLQSVINQLTQQEQQEQNFSVEQEEEVGVPPQKENEEKGEETMYCANVTVCGHFAADPTLIEGTKEDHSDDRCLFRLMGNEPGSDTPDVYNCIAWGTRARAIAEHCKKGKEMLVSGVLKTYSKKDDAGVWTNRWEIRVNQQSFGAMSNKGRAADAPAAPTSSSEQEDLQKVLALLQNPAVTALLAGGTKKASDKPF